MESEQKQYILDNINKKSIKQIAQELNIKERKIRKFLQHRTQKKKDKPKETVSIYIKKNTLLVSLGLIVILGFLVYANSLGGVFLWDDEDLVTHNIYLRHFSQLPNLFTKNIGAGVAKGGNFYRPLQMITYMIDYALWKRNPLGYHLTNILLHILATITLWWLVTILFKDPLLSLITCLLFLVHPLHTEAISYISGRADPLALVCILLCFIFYLRALGGGGWSYLLTVVCFALALLSRESATVVPLAFLLYHYTFREKIKLKLILPLVGMSVLYIILRLTLLKSLLPDIAACPYNIGERISGFFFAMSRYVQLFFLPFNLHMGYGNVLPPFAHPRALIGMLIVVSLLFFGFKTRNSNRLFFFAVGWFFINLLPQSNLYPINAYMAEHWLYTPSIGFFLIIASFLLNLYRRKNTRIIALFVIVGLTSFYSYLTVRQNWYWQKPKRLYEHTLQFAPQNPTLYNNLGIIYFDSGKREESIELFKKAVQVDPSYVGAYFNLGKAFRAMGNNQEAVSYYKKALEIDPSLVMAYNSLGLLYYSMGESKEAIPFFKKAIALSPQYARAHNNLGIAYYAQGDYQSAASSYKKAIAIDVTFAEAYCNLGIVYRVQGRNADAISVFKKAIKFDPTLGKAYANLAAIYFSQKKDSLAREYFDKAKELGLSDAALSEVLPNSSSQ